LTKSGKWVSHICRFLPIVHYPLSTIHYPLQHIPAQVAVFDDIGELLLHVAGVNGYLLLADFRRFEGEFFKQPFHHRIEPARTDILGTLIDLLGQSRDLGDGILGELQLDALGVQ
jgi:hypothetical protein